jgi:hypothetical protein
VCTWFASLARRTPWRCAARRHTGPANTIVLAKNQKILRVSQGAVLQTAKTTVLFMGVTTSVLRHGLTSPKKARNMNMFIFR